jgi:UDP-N-acetylmuramate dehydrogenase
MMNLRANVDLAQITYYRIGGTADLLIEVSSIEDIRSALAWLQRRGVTAVFPLGLGSNVLLPDAGYRGAILRLRPSPDGFRSEPGGNVTAFAGNTIEQLLRYTLEQRFSGLAWSAGLPSSIGGAIRGNAGAFGAEMSGSVTCVQAIDVRNPSSRIKTFTKEECRFGYRDSIFKHDRNLLIISATISLHPSGEDTVQQEWEKCRSHKLYRAKRHPLAYPSCGSVFKNIVSEQLVMKVIQVWPDVEQEVASAWHGKVPMAYVVRRLGMAGYRVGDAQVSEKHANFISNLGHAKAADVAAIIAAISTRCTTTFGFAPELEVEIVGAQESVQ